ncbi:MAG: carboxypeptidase regulatory-like domain-containing protein [Persicimonas sp.]
MFELPKGLNRALLLVAFTCLAAACSDDTSTGGGAQECAAGEEFNKLEGTCELRSDNNTTGNNTSDDPDAGGDDGDHTAEDDGGNTTDDGGSSEDDTGDGGHNDDPPDGDDDPDVPEECGPGDVIGMACAPSGERLGGATVTIEGNDCDGNPFTETTTTDSNGEYSFSDIPAGQHTLTISSGSFSSNQPIIVRAGETLDLSQSNSKVCLDGANVEIAVIEGAYDHVSGVLDDLQLDYDVKGDDVSTLGGQYEDSRDFLNNQSAMDQYDIIFINCGELWNQLEANNSNMIPSIINNLEIFVDNGGSLYVADWSHPFMEKMYADAVDFLGDDTNINEARRGYAPQTITAEVTSPEMQNVLGQNEATIEFPHNPPNVINTHWVVAEGIGAGSTTHLSGDAELCTSHFDGTECQQGGGTQADSPLLVTHQTQSGGTAIYTAFHNERQGVNTDTEQILKFLIFQL